MLAGILAGIESPDLRQAQNHFLETLQLAEQRGMRPLVVRCCLGLARLHERTADATAALGYRERAGRLADELGMSLASLEPA